MNRKALKEYLDTRRREWPYEGRYHVDRAGDHRFVAKVGDELAGLSYAVIVQPGEEAQMKMNLKKEYAEYGIGTELLELLMDDLRCSGYKVIRYEISKDHYAYQIYRNLGLTIESQDLETIRFIYKSEN